MSDLTLVKNDKLIPIGFTINDSSGDAVDLTGLTITFKVGNTSGNLFSGDCSITDANNGQCTYTIQDGDLSTEGTYRGEIQITYPSGKIQTTSNIIINILGEL